MPWYKSGTVSVTQNSNAVMGTNTAFIANSRVGDGFRGPDGRWYEVTNIASNTALSITPNYEGPTAAGGFYSIMPVQGYQKDLSDQVRAILNNYGDKLAALGTTGNYEILPLEKGGTGSSNPGEALTGLGFSDFMKTIVDDPNATVARGTLIAAKSGPNSDITELNGLTKLLTLAQGGTGKTSMGAAAIGPVSQVGGVPTGAIFETGVNSNGRYTKYADGRMYCEATIPKNPFAVTSGIGSLFYGFTGLWTYPAPFVGGTPFSICMPIANGQIIWGVNRAVNQTNSAVEFVILSVVSYTQDTTFIMRAWGRWF
ncbi:hypothetical protein [Pseudomonas sp. S3_B08]